MKKLLILILYLALRPGYSQTSYQLYVDSVGKVISQYIDDNLSDYDSSSFMAYFTGLSEKIVDSTRNLTQQQLQELPVFILFRVMHHNNLVASYIANKVPKSAHWVVSNEMPASSITPEDCAAFWKYQKFIYHDSDSTVVRLTLTEDFWIDSMADNTYSKLAVRKLNDQTFESSFIGSNNPLKHLLSIPGDIYHYQLLKKTDHSYKLSTHMNGISTYFIFELEF